MPFCTECGARHDDTAEVCPKCGQPIFTPPAEDDLDDVLASLDDLPGDPGSAPLAEAPAATMASPGYLEEIQEVRGAIAAQSTALQELTDLSWDAPIATQIRDELTLALGQLHELTPPSDLAEAHEDFVQGAERLVHGFVALVDAIANAEEDDKVDAAQEEIATATERFRRGADALNDYLILHGEDPAAEQALDLSDLDDVAASPPAATDTPAELELDLPDDFFKTDDDATEAEPAASDDEDDDVLAIDDAPPENDDLAMSDPLAEDEGSELSDDSALPIAEEDEELPEMPAELEGLDLPEPDFGATPATLPSYGGGPMPPMPEPEDEPEPVAPDVSASMSGADVWPSLGDASTDAILREIEGGWVRGRPPVYEAIERAIRSAVSDALRNALEMRRRVEADASAVLQRIAGERNRLLNEVDSLRREATSLQSEAADLRRQLNDLERERQGALDRRHHVLQEAETHRSQLLGEVEQLRSQLDAMHQTIVTVLNRGAALQDSPAGQGDELATPPDFLAQEPTRGQA